MALQQVEPVKVDRETIIECTKCGKEFQMAFDTDVDLEKDSDLYKELLEDHQFMCSSDFPDFEVKKKKETKLINSNDIGKVLYTLWDENVEVPNETEHTQYNKGYMHALAHVKKQILGGDNFPGELKEQSFSKRNRQTEESS